MDDRWCILRTSGAKTLPLAAALCAAGFDVWTPVRIEKRRVHRARKEQEDRPVAIMPSFVFAQARHLADLARVLRLPINPYPGFSLFRHNGRVPLLAEREIDRLRMAERRALPRAQRPTFAKGATVRPTEGPYAGLSGIVQESDGRFTMIAFGGWMDVQIETFALHPDEVEQNQPIAGTAALAA